MMLARSSVQFILLFNCRILGRRYISETPLTIRGSKNVQIKKVWKDLKAKEEMEKHEMMEPVDLPELPRAIQGHILDLDRCNKERVTRNFETLYKGLVIIWACIALVCGIYFFGCWAMGRESLLEEIDEEIAIERGELVLDAHGNPVPA